MCPPHSSGRLSPISETQVRHWLIEAMHMKINCGGDRTLRHKCEGWEINTAKQIYSTINGAEEKCHGNFWAGGAQTSFFFAFLGGSILKKKIRFLLCFFCRFLVFFCVAFVEGPCSPPALAQLC